MELTSTQKELLRAATIVRESDKLIYTLSCCQQQHRVVVHIKKYEACKSYLTPTIRMPFAYYGAIELVDHVKTEVAGERQITSLGGQALPCMRLLEILRADHRVVRGAYEHQTSGLPTDNLTAELVGSAREPAAGAMLLNRYRRLRDGLIQPFVNWRDAQEKALDLSLILQPGPYNIMAYRIIKNDVIATFRRLKFQHLPPSRPESDFDHKRPAIGSIFIGTGLHEKEAPTCVVNLKILPAPLDVHRYSEQYSRTVTVNVNARRWLTDVYKRFRCAVINDNLILSVARKCEDGRFVVACTDLTEPIPNTQPGRSDPYHAEPRYAWLSYDSTYQRWIISAGPCWSADPVIASLPKLKLPKYAHEIVI